MNATKVNASGWFATVKGTLTLGSNANITANSGLVGVLQNAVINLNGTVNAPTIVVANAGYNKQYGDTNAVVTVNGGTYTATSSDAFTIDKGIELVINDVKTVTAANRAIHLTEGSVTIKNGEFVAKTMTGILVDGNSEETSLTISNGKVVALGATKYALSLKNPNATYAISGGTFESAGKLDAIELGDSFYDSKTGELIAKVKGILTGGKYLNNIVSVVRNPKTGANYNPTTDLVAKDYTVKEEGKYKVVVSTKAEDDKKPAAKPEEQAPNTYDAGLVYMGLALSAIGASVVSVRKLRNN